MMAKTHIASAEAVALPIFYYLVAPNAEAALQYLPLVAGSVALGAIIPDIDEPRSRIGRMMPASSGILSMFITHRTWTHSIPIWGAVWLIALIMWLFSSVSTVVLLLLFGISSGCILHTLGDMTTNAPVRGALFPISKRLYWIVPRWARYNVGSFVEYLYFAAFCLILGAFGFFGVMEQAERVDIDAILRLIKLPSSL